MTVNQSSRRRGSKGIALLLTLVVCLGASISAIAQSDNAQISGFVKDSAGAVVAGAKVVAKSQAKSVERSATTNDQGYYIIPNLPPDVYTITVEQTGFKRLTVADKKVDPNIAATVDFSLDVGQVTEVVSVVAQSNTVQSESATVGKLVEGAQIQLLQLNGRNPLFLALLKPGVSGGALGGFSFGLTSGGLNINGSRTQDNLITLDGAVGIRTRSNGTSIGVADVDATQEVQILTATYGSEYGRSNGGQIRIVTKSGGRDLHGTFYEFMRNSAFDANTWGRNNSGSTVARPCDEFRADAHCRPEPFRYNQFGYSLSGPVVLPFTEFNKGRDKLFWLWGQEWVRRRRAVTRAITVPTLRMRNGDFSELLGTNRFFSTPIQIRDPQTGQPFSGNVIPANRLSPNGIALLRAFPEPNFVGPGSSNWFAERPETQDQRKDSISIDFYPNQNHSIRWRAQLYHFLEFAPFPFGGDPGLAPRIFDRPNQTTSFNWVWSISPNWINEVLVAGSRDQVFISVAETDLFKRSQYGINYPYLFPDRKEIPDKVPTVAGLAPFGNIDGGPYPAQSTGPIYQFSNNMTNIRGNHTLKFGVYLERAGQNDFDQINVAGTPGGTNNQNGRFAFVNTTVGGVLQRPSIANAALGLFDTYAEIGVRSFTPYRGHMFEWFFQDSWKVTPKLRLEGGIRHSIIQPYYSLWRNMVVFDQRFYDPSIAVTQNPANGFITSGNLQSRFNGLVIPGNGWTDAASGRVPISDSGEFDFLFRGVSKEYSRIHKGNLQPRIGIAYAMNDKTVFRAGAGRFFTRLGVSDSVFLGGNPPLQPTASVTNGSVDNPGRTAGNVFPLVITTQDPIFKNPEAWHWSFTFEREIGFATVVEVGYVGRRGLHGQRERNINQLQPGTRQANPGINPDFLRPFKGFGVIRVTNNDANSMYHGLQIGVNRRFTSGFSFGMAYTLSKSEDDGSAQRDVIPNAFDASALWGPSTFDRRHVMVLNAIYDLPFFKDGSTLRGKVLGGWKVSAVSQFQTGTPITIATGDDFAGVGPGSGAQIWLVRGNPTPGDKRFSTSSSDQNYWFLPKNPDGSDIFVRPAAGTFNTDRVRGLLYGPGFQNHNLGVFKDFIIREGHKFQFRFEAFNWPNHPNWNGPETNPTSANFGKITSKSSERNLQFALRYAF
jgi:hypothetical protein